MEKWELLYTTAGNVKWTIVVPRKGNSTPTYTSHRTENRYSNKLYTTVYVRTFQNSQKVETTQIPSMDEQRNKIWHIHTMEYCLVLQNNDI